jgi:hypothetical protein
MNFQVYPQIYVSKDWMTFKFERENRSGHSWYAVQFCKIEPRGYYNLAMGELHIEDPEKQYWGPIDDFDRIIATLGAIVFAWLERFPRRSLIFHGNDEVYNRLYRMAINRAWDSISPLFDVKILKNGEAGGLVLGDFAPDATCAAFVLSRKLVQQYPKPPPASIAFHTFPSKIFSLSRCMKLSDGLWRRRKITCPKITRGCRCGSSAGMRRHRQRTGPYFPKRWSEQGNC